MIHTNAKSVTIPFFRVGVPEPDLQATLDTIELAFRAQQPEQPKGPKGRAA